jgi:cell division protein FtsZ
MSQKVDPDVETFARIKVVGIGGSGLNAVNHMIDSSVDGVEFIAINTDAQDLHHSKADNKIHIGKNLTKGLGTGMNPDMGRRAAEETKEEIQGALQGADMVFITCGMGGGTGTGGAPIVAQTARETGALTVAVVTKPFFFEGAERTQLAEEGLHNLQNEVDALIVIPNDRLLQTVEEDTTAQEAFALCDEILREAVEGISDLITTPGIINVDFADVRSVMENAGSALMGVGRGSDDKRAIEAAKSAINSPLLDISIDGAKGVLFAIAGGEDLKMHEIQEAADIITESIDEEAKVIFGAINDDRLKKKELRITVIASGFPEDRVIQSDSSMFEFGGNGNNDNDSQRSETKRSEEKKKEEMYETVNDTVNKNKQKNASDQRDDDADTPRSRTATNQNDGDEDWGAVPAFLRRSKDEDETEN